jgi:phosphatidate cytidylyltransferase
MIKRLGTAAILIPFVIAIVSWAPQWAFILSIEIFLLVAIWELFQLMGKLGARGLIINAGLIACAPLIWSLSEGLGTKFVLLAPFFILALSLRASPDLRNALHSASLNLLAFFYLVIPFSLAVLLRGEPGLTANWPNDLVILFIAVWISDSAAFFVGRTLGKHYVTPNLSPGKSLEGFFAGMFFPAFGMAWLGPSVLPDQSILFLFLLGLTLGLAAIIGDLFESMIKRAAHVKDVSDLIPGHGGVLDRMDSLLFAIPWYYMFYQVTELLQL